MDRTGCERARLPHDFPSWQSAYGHFVHWQQDGIFAPVNGLLRELARQREGRDKHPPACVIDAQSVMTDPTAHRLTGEGTNCWRDPTQTRQSRIQR
nr:transposase [Streptomyces sp. A1499]